MTTTDLAAPTDRTPSRPTIGDQVRQMESQFALAMPKGAEAAQLVRDALTAIRQTPHLSEAEPASVLGALMTCAQLGLRPGVLGHAWVLPYWNARKRIYEAQLIVGYQGLTELAYRSGNVSSIIARTVYANDTFDVEFGLHENLIHRPNLTEPGDPIAHYAVVHFRDGGANFWVMTEPEMQAWRKRYAPTNKAGNIIGPWNSDYEAMARKTCLLRLAKWMPKSTEFAHAVEVDNGVRTNIDPSASVSVVTNHDHIRAEVADAEPVAVGEVLNPEPTPANAFPEDGDPA